MKRVQNLCIALWVIIGLVVLPSCVDEPNTTTPHIDSISSPVQLAIDFDSVLSFKAMLDDSCIYLSTSDGSAEYYRAYFDGTVVKLGTVPNFLLSMKHTVTVDDIVYLFASVYDDAVNNYANDLVAINVADNTLQQYVHYDGSTPGIPIYNTSESILTLKSKKASDLLTTYIESYNLRTGTWAVLDSQTLDLNSYEGTAIFGVCANANRMCVLYDKRSGLSAPIETRVDVYDMAGTLEYSFLVDNDMHDYVMTSSISDMQVIGDYIYFYNASNYGLLAKITPTGLVEVAKNRNLEISRSAESTDTAIFYVRRSDTIFYLDADAGTFECAQLKLGSGSSIQSMFSNGDTVFLTCYGATTQYAYLIDTAYLTTAFFPCS